MGSFLTKFMEFYRANPKKAMFLGLVFYMILKKLYRRMKRNDNAFRNKIVLITGGAMGLGKLTALNCKKEGSTVIVWDINETELSKLRANNTVDLAMKVDVTNRAAVLDAASKVLKEYGKIDILINNAGIVSGKTFMQLSEKDIRRTMDVNVISHFWTLQAFLPIMMKNNSGHIVTISSTAGKTGVPYLTDYCSSKHACLGLDDSLRHELMDFGYDNIKFSCICPYFINTGMFAGATAARDPIVGFFAYFLDPERVANEIMLAVKEETRELILPYRLAPLFWIKEFLPLWLADHLVLQSSNMSNFYGRSASNINQSNLRTMGMSNKQLGMDLPQ